MVDPTFFVTMESVGTFFATLYEHTQKHLGIDPEVIRVPLGGES